MHFVLLFHRRFPLPSSTKLPPHSGGRFHPFALGTLILALSLLALAHTAHAYTSVMVAWDANPESDISGYKVFLGTASGNFSQTQDVGKATSAMLPGLTPATTYYCVVQAYDIDGFTSDLSGEISFTTRTAAALFNKWVASGGLSGSVAVPAAMPFHDGVPNLLKYAFNLNIAGPDRRVLTKGTGTAGLPVFTMDRSGSQAWFKVEFLRRKGNGLVYTPKISTDLVTYAPMPDTTPTVTAINDDWERVVVQQPYNPASNARLFGRVEVTLPDIMVTPEIVVTDSAGTSLADGVSTISFGSAGIGSADSSQTITLSNTGTANLTGLAITLDGTNPADFTASAPSSTTVAPNESTTFTITFKPTTAGTRNAVIHIASNDPNKAVFDIALSGSGVTAAELFNTWATAGGLSGSAAAPAAIPFHDGVPNLLKYAFNPDTAGSNLRVLAQGSGTASLPVFTLDRSGSQTWFKVEFLRRKGCALVYTPKISTDLVTYKTMTGTRIVTRINDDWERVTLRQPCNPANTAKLFGKVEVTLP